MVTKQQIEKTTVYPLFSLFIQFSAIEIRWVYILHALLCLLFLNCWQLGLDTNTPKNALKIYPEILNFFPKIPSKNLWISPKVSKNP